MQSTLFDSSEKTCKKKTYYGEGLDYAFVEKIDELSHEDLRRVVVT